MEKQQFEQLALQHRDMIYRIALNQLRSIPDAEDAMQEVLLKLYQHKGSFNSDTHAKHWLIRVTLNHCRSLWRSPWKRNVPLEALSRTIGFTEQKDSDLFLAVMDLPEVHRTMLYLFYYEDLSIRDIAQLMNLSVSTVTTRLYRARKRLKYDLTEGANQHVSR